MKQFQERDTTDMLSLRKQPSVSNYIKVCLVPYPIMCQYVIASIIGRGKTWPLACCFPNCLFVGGNCDRINSHRWRNNEVILPNSLWTLLFFESAHNRRVVPGVHLSVHRVIPTPKPQLDRRTVTCRGRNSYYLLDDGMGALSEPTETSHDILPTSCGAIY